MKCKSIEWFLYNRTFCRRKFVDRLLNLLGDSWNYMPPILVPSSAKRMGIQVLVIAKLMKDKILFWEVLFLISSVPTGNNVSNWHTRIRFENSSRLRLKTLERCQWRHSSVYIVNCKHISNILVITDFEKANVFWVHNERINFWRQDQVYHSLCCSNLCVAKIY